MVAGWSVARLDPLDQLLNRRNEAIRVERVVFEPVSIVTCKHQLIFRVIRVADLLQRLLYAIRSWIGLLSGRALLILRPVREEAGAQTTHAVDLVREDLV